MNIRLISAYLLLLLSMAGCRSLKNTTDPELARLPHSYAKVSDSTATLPQDSLNAASIQWKEYFTDSTLVSFVELGLANNPDLLTAMQRIQVARADVLSAKGMLFPTLSANISIAQRKYGLYTMDGAGNITTEITPGQIVPIHLPDYYTGFQTTWEADIWGKLRNKKRAATARYLSSVEGVHWAVTNLVSEIATTYYSLLALDNERDIIRQTIVLQEEALSTVTIQKEAGAANELAVKQFQAQLLNSKSLELEIAQQIIVTENTLNFLLGRYPQAVIRERTAFTAELPGQIEAGIPSQLLINRPDIRQAEFELTASKANVKAARAAFYPSLNINGTLGFQAFQTAFLFTSPQSLAYGIIGSLTAPLINRTAIRASFNTAKANQTAALYDYQKSIINGYVEVYNEMANIRNLKQMYDLRSQEVEVLNESIGTSAELFRTGRATYLEILMTQQKTLQAKLELINTQKRQYNAMINLYRALGGGWK